ncbi:MAG: hypothetical protein WAX80_02920 [Minisyncoccia bacterium]
MKFLLLTIIVFFLIQDFKLRKLAKRGREVVDLHCDMWAKMRELFDDPTMSYLKWKEWLPIFEAADERCMRLEPEMAMRLGSVAEKVRNIIKDDGYQCDMGR